MKKQKQIKNVIIVPIVIFTLMISLLLGMGVALDVLLIVCFCFIFMSMYFIYIFLYKKQDLFVSNDSQRTDEIFNMIAHQWRQPLSAISSSASSLELKMLIGEYDKASFHEIVKNILAYTQHMSLTINEFRHFFKDSKIKSQTSFEYVIQDCVDIINIGLKDTNIEIQVQNEYKEELKIYENEFKQVVLNLLRNAQDAILQNRVENGKIIIKTYKDDSDIIFEVIDNGGGIKQEILEKIFDPYFSTKNKKNATGIGLYMSKTIIERHCKGTLGCFNNDEGAVFRIILKPLNLLAKD